MWFHKISLDGKSPEIGLYFQRAPGGQVGWAKQNHVLSSAETDSFLWRRSGDILPLAYQMITSTDTSISNLWALSQTKRELVACSGSKIFQTLEQVRKIIIWLLWTWKYHGGTFYKRNNSITTLRRGTWGNLLKSQSLLTSSFLSVLFLE